MKILSIGNFGHGWDGSICDEEHIAAALERAGHTVTRVQRDNKEDYRQVDETHDFALLAQWDGYPEALIIALQLTHIPVVYWAFDYQDPNQEWHKKLVKECNLYLSKRLDDPINFPDANWRWLAQDFAPDFLEPYGTKEGIPWRELQHDIDVLFTGSWVPWESGQERVELLKKIDSRHHLVIHSVTPDQWKEAGFKNVFGPVMDRDLPWLISRAKINFSMDHVLSPGYWSDRNAQIMACGGFVLFRYVPKSEFTFRDNIGYFKTDKECLDEIQHYLDNQHYAREMAEKGTKFAHEHLMVDNRVQDLLMIVKEAL